nr:hypothetical protein GCM10020063_104310 [Dactylosporangium thailandense]
MSLLPEGRCPHCAAMEVRLLVVIHCMYYLTLHVPSSRFRGHIIDDLTSGYSAILKDNEELKFADFFDAYRTRVESELNPARIRAGERTSEYRRVWTDHAILLGERQFERRKKAIGYLVQSA